MTCTFETYEAMAEAGWSQAQIKRLRLEVELARREAEASAFSRGLTRSMQMAAMDAAESATRRIAHDRWHNELADDMREINALNAFVETNPGEHYGSGDREVVLAAGGEGNDKHLQKQKKEVR
jgi:hypothetical protein